MGKEVLQPKDNKILWRSLSICVERMPDPKIRQTFQLLKELYEKPIPLSSQPSKRPDLSARNFAFTVSTENQTILKNPTDDSTHEFYLSSAYHPQPLQSSQETTTLPSIAPPVGATDEDYDVQVERNTENSNESPQSKRRRSILKPKKKPIAQGKSSKQSRPAAQVGFRFPKPAERAFTKQLKE
eukprot:TRINITY_DN2825_c0_g3_i1.p1 TRINITY_DN2825_c0_g3~~TRINITY_DN2825_c0_g3_i1.p1  ORF type:complete len:212 (-),score=58.32 TRINITY_DN2825_c0_g3_i1:95-646(-)